MANKVEAVGKMLDLLTVASAFLTQAMIISKIIQQADSEGRQQLTDAEWEQINETVESARDRALAAVDQKTGQ